MRRIQRTSREGIFYVQVTTGQPRLTVTVDGAGVVFHAGVRLLVDLAEVTGLRAGFSDALGGLRRRGTGHDPGRVLADGGVCISDLGVLRDQAGVFGPVASTATAWRVLARSTMNS